MLFADLLSLHLVTFLMFFILVIIFRAMHRSITDYLVGSISIVRLEWTMEFLCIANGATLHFVLASFALFHRQTSAKSPLLRVRLLAMHPLKKKYARDI